MLRRATYDLGKKHFQNSGISIAITRFDLFGEFVCHDIELGVVALIVFTPFIKTQSLSISIEETYF